MSRENQKINASFVEYGSNSHKLLNRYEFHFTNEDKTELSITKPDGTVIPNLSLGSQLSDIGIIGLDDADDLTVGKYKIHQGKGLLFGWSAKRSSGKKVKITDPSGNEHIGTIGEHFSPLNSFISGKDECGNLSLKSEHGDFTIKHLTKTKTVSLTVLKTPDNGGFKGYMTEQLPAKKGGKRPSVNITFYDNKPNVPAYITTKYAGVDVAIAIFDLDKDNNKTSIKMFSPEDALELKIMKTRMAAISRECHSFKIDPNDHQEFVNLNKKANEIKLSSKPVDFNVAIGQVYFGLKYDQSKTNKKAGYRKNHGQNFVRG